MPSIYGAGLYGAGTYGGLGLALPPPVIAPEPPRRVTLPVHSLGVGPRADDAAWRAMPNKGLPSSVYRAAPIVGLGDYRRASATLRRTAAGEASVDLDSARADAAVIEEMVTDLWWRRLDPQGNTLDDVGRFNADTVDVSFDGGRLRCSATFADYRGLLEDRLVLAASPTGGHAAGSPVVDALYAILPADSGIDMTALAVTDLGVLSDPLEYQQNTRVGDAITALQLVAPAFDWSVEMGPAPAGTPTLALWPGGRGTDRGVVLHDDGTGATPVLGWRRRTNRADYATRILYSGQTGSQLAEIPGGAAMPTGVRETTDSNPDLITATLIAKAAQKAIEDRSVRRAGWDIQLAPGFWRGRTHIDLGDPIRVIIRLGADVLDETHDVEEITCEVDANGVEQVSLSLGWGRPAANPNSRRAVASRIVRRIERLARK